MFNKINDNLNNQLHKGRFGNGRKIDFHDLDLSQAISKKTRFKDELIELIKSLISEKEEEVLVDYKIAKIKEGENLRKGQLISFDFFSRSGKELINSSLEKNLYTSNGLSYLNGLSFSSDSGNRFTNLGSNSTVILRGREIEDIIHIRGSTYGQIISEDRYGYFFLSSNTKRSKLYYITKEINQTTGKKDIYETDEEIIPSVNMFTHDNLDGKEGIKNNTFFLISNNIFGEIVGEKTLRAVEFKFSNNQILINERSFEFENKIVCVNKNYVLTERNGDKIEVCEFNKFSGFSSSNFFDIKNVNRTEYKLHDLLVRSNEVEKYGKFNRISNGGMLYGGGFITYNRYGIYLIDTENRRELRDFQKNLMRYVLLNILGRFLGETDREVDVLRIRVVDFYELKNDKFFIRFELRYKPPGTYSGYFEKYGFYSFISDGEFIDHSFLGREKESISSHFFVNNGELFELDSSNKVYLVEQNGERIDLLKDISRSGNRIRDFNTGMLSHGIFIGYNEDGTGNYLINGDILQLDDSFNINFKLDDSFVGEDAYYNTEIDKISFYGQIKIGTFLPGNRIRINIENIKYGNI